MGREFRSRMRGARSYWITGGYTLLVSVMVLVVYHFAGFGTAVTASTKAADVGRAIWLWGCVGQAIVLPLVVPAFTCGAITLERERDMLELLLLTRQSPFQICFGKLLSGAGLGLTLVLASVPVLSLSFLLGGVAPFEVAASVCVLASAVIAAAALGLAASSIAPRTQSASATSYAIVGFTLIGFPLLMTLVHNANSFSTTNAELGILAMLIAYIAITFVPGVALAAVIHFFYRRRHPQPVTRAWWELTAGLSWCGLLALLYLPGMTELLLEGSLLLELHPVSVIAGLMNNVAPSPPGTLAVFSWTDPRYRWLLSSTLSVLIAVWCLQIAVLRVRRLRAG